MAQTTTTTTTKEEKGVRDEDTTTTTTTHVETAPAPTGDNASVNYPGGDASPLAERQGEVAIDKDAKTDVVGTDLDSDRSAADQDADTQAQNIEQSKQDGLRAHAREQSEQPGNDRPRR